MTDPACGHRPPVGGSVTSWIPPNAPRRSSAASVPTKASCSARCACAASRMRPRPSASVTGRWRRSLRTSGGRRRARRQRATLEPGSSLPAWGQDVGLVLTRRRRPATLLVLQHVGGAPVAPPGGRSSAHRDGRIVGSRLGRVVDDPGARANVTGLAFYRRLGFEVLLEGGDAESGARYDALAMRRPIVPP